MSAHEARRRYAPEVSRRGKHISGHRSYIGHTPHLTICGQLRSTRHAGGSAKIARRLLPGSFGVFPMTCAHVRALASTSRFAPSGEFTSDEKPRCITAKFEKSHPALWGHY